MHFEKTEKIGTEWLLVIGTHRIPMVAMGNFLKMIFICVSIALAYNMGALWAMTMYDQFKDAGLKCTPEGCYSCSPVQQGNQIIMLCNSTNTPSQFKQQR